jgi:hypothetical protein
MLPAALLALAAALGSGLTLVWSPRLMLLAHLAAGLGGLVPLLLFLHRHWWRRRRRIGRHANARFGYVALAAMILLVLSGLALLRWTSWVWLQRSHSAAALILTIDLAVHASWRWRQRRAQGKVQPMPAAPLVALGAMFLLGGLTFVAVPSAAEPPPAPDPLPVAHDALKTADLLDGALPTAADCATCHAELTGQWRQSAHAHAVTDTYYQALITLFIQERGVAAARYCAACHNPVGLLRGEIDLAALDVATTDGLAYEVRSLGVELAISPAAAEGVSCIVCHRSAEPLSTDGRAVLPTNRLPDGWLESLALGAVPDRHRTAMNPEVLAEAELCRSCHNLRTPEGLLLEPTFDEWLASPYADEGITCQSCHMPEATGRAVDSLVGGKTTVHGGLPGAPSSLPGVSDYPGLLQQAATLALYWEAAKDGRLAVTAQVSNSGAGHYLPTGADDLRQVWLEVTLSDATGAVAWQAGALAPDGRLGPEAVLFRKVLGDARDRPVDLHRFWVATQILEDTRLAPGETRDVRFDLGPADLGSGPYTLAARLLYRDVPPDFAEFATGQPVTNWPAVEMVTATAVIP